ncbi:nuclear factor 7, ovary-like [Pungitius pungitius]|uniref:nuclear factor 7, ovary-like n=1 Tax=Pungitius pungitius TaxID=134920 RepID=UPI002E11C9D6
MASRSDEDLCCPVCCEIFENPVVLPCSHSFCRDCVKNWWSEKKIKECPVCRKRSKSEPPCNLALKNLCEAFLLKRDQNGPEKVCKLHSEKLRLFCLDHQQPVCLVCRDSKIHTGHRFRPIDEAAEDLKDEIQKYLKPLKEKLKLFEEVKGNCDQTAAHMKVQARHTEKMIKDQFKKLHQFLEEEEEARISALREEEEQKSQMMEKKMEALSREIAALSDTVRATVEQLRAEDVSFLNHYKAALERVQQRPLLEDPQLPSGALIDQAKHLGNLTYNIWIKMMDVVSYSPVVLDPNTAHPELLLSEDLTSVRFGEPRELPENPERFDRYRVVWGSEGFHSGTHSWDCKVRDHKSWSLGVSQRSVQKKGKVSTGYWELCFMDGKYVAVSPPLSNEVLPVKEKLRRIRVHLDCDEGELSFCDPDTDTHIFTFTQVFADTLFPHFETLNELPLKILPNEVFVSTSEIPKCFG